jgi:predicted nucleotidyltransferase component of viral defense system
VTRDRALPRSYPTPAAFRVALEARLAVEAANRAVDLGRLRRQVAFERLLVRLAASRHGEPAWVLKGGLALELRLSGKSRSTRDLDLATLNAPTDGATVRDRLTEALDAEEQGDGFAFAVAAPRLLAADRGGRPGWRFPVEALLADRTFVKVRLDVVARAEEIDGGVEDLTFRSALAFAGLPPMVTVRAVDLEQHAAEKFHALTREYGDRPNTRVKDLVDLVLLVELSLVNTTRLAARIQRVFAVRSTHPLPVELPPLPPAWREDYGPLVADLDLAARTADAAFASVNSLWKECFARNGND